MPFIPQEQYCYVSLDYDASLADPAFQVSFSPVCLQYQQSHIFKIKVIIAGEKLNRSSHSTLHWFKRFQNQTLDTFLCQEESVRLPDGNMIVMGQQKFSAPEIIFQVAIIWMSSLSTKISTYYFPNNSLQWLLPTPSQPDLASKKTCGLGELVYYSLMKCDEKVPFLWQKPHW